MRGAIAKLLVAAIVALAALQPAVALACPSCKAQEESLPPVLKLLGAFILVPFLIAYFVIRAIRKVPPPHGHGGSNP